MVRRASDAMFWVAQAVMLDTYGDEFRSSKQDICLDRTILCE